jgi:hypothetical protein
MEKIFAAFVLVLCFFVACADNGTSTSTTSLGDFDYRAFDVAGSVRTEGSITLIADDSIVTGTWWFNDGTSGRLTGKKFDGKIDLNLHPDLVDANLLLLGTLDGNRYAGEWQQTGFGGVLEEGTFVATRKTITH